MAEAGKGEGDVTSLAMGRSDSGALSVLQAPVERARTAFRGMKMVRRR